MDRYFFDRNYCSYKNGWAQLDTTQDAWYFGQWINPDKLRILSYVEGDVREIQFDNIKEVKTYLKGYDYIKIDPGLTPEFKQKFIDFGLDEFFHKKL